MMQEENKMGHSDSIWAAIVKTASWVAALLGSVALAEWQALAGLICTCLVAAGAAVSLYTALKRKAWRDTK